MAAKRTRKLLVWALCLHTYLVFGQTTFQKTFGGLGNEVATWVAEASNGFVVAGHVTGTTGNQDALLVRFNASGNIIWQKRYGGAQADAFRCVAATPDGGFVALGATKSYGAGAGDMFLVKVDDAGQTLWSKTIGDVLHEETALAVSLVPSGGFVVSGSSVLAGQLLPSSILVRMDPDGNILWSRSYASLLNNNLVSNYIDGNIIYAGGSVDAEGVFARFDLSNGNVLSAKAFGGNGVEVLSHQQLAQDGNLILSDYTRAAAPGAESKLWVQKINKTSGQVIWSKVYGRPYDNIRGGIERVNDGGFLLVPYNEDNGAQADALLAKIDASGNLLWAYNFGGGAADRLIKAFQTPDGGFIAVGDTRSNSVNSNSDILLVKIDANGHIQGNCPKAAGLISTAFSAENLTAQLTGSSWLQGSTLNLTPLSLNLSGQAYHPNASPIVIETVPLCPNKAYKINGVDYFAPKVIPDTIFSLNGCDTIVHYNLTLTPFNTGIHVIGLCTGETYSVNGVSYTAPNTVLDTLPSLTGDCDTVYTYVLKAWAQPAISHTLAFCPGESVMIGGQVYTQTGTVQSSIPSATGGCDTLVTYHLVERAQPVRSATISFCPGESVIIGGNTYSVPGTVVTTAPALNGGCDTLVTYTLVERSQPTRNTTIAFCPGESVIIGGNTYDHSGVVLVNAPSSNGGCDTLITYNLVYQPQPVRAETRKLCPGQSVTIGGQTYNQSATVLATLPALNGGCDTLVTYTLELQAQPQKTETLAICPGGSVAIAGQTYTQAGTFIVQVPAVNGGCDTLATYTLEIKPQISRNETRSFCPGSSVLIAGQSYTQPGTVVANIPSGNGGCDTVVTYTLEIKPQIARNETRSFCPGETVLIGGQTYTQPGTVSLQLPSVNGGCDTLVTYTLQHLTPAPSNIAIQCPADITVSVASGARTQEAVYAEPVAASDCICPGLSLTRTDGLASGSLFPAGITRICYIARDNCGQEKPCCFSVDIREENPCDVKENGCLKYELLGVTADQAKNHTYRIRVTNHCSNKLIYTAIQIPEGITAMAPANNSVFATDQERGYIVRSPNYLPMYSIRFKSTSDSISNGESDIFEYTLPAQAEVRFIQISSKLAGVQALYEAHLNTFNCPEGITPEQQGTKSREAETVVEQNSLLLFPNPSTGVLFADLSDWEGKQLNIQISNNQAQVLHTVKCTAGAELFRLELPSAIPTGIYFMEVATTDGKKEVMRFMLKR